MVMGFSGKASLHPRAEAHCHWLRSRGVHAGDAKILIEPLNRRSSDQLISDSGSLQVLPTYPESVKPFINLFIFGLVF